MQQLGHLNIDGEKISVLVRVTKNHDGFFVTLKLRTGGKYGKEMTDEAEFLKTEPQKLADLRDGRVVIC